MPHSFDLYTTRADLICPSDRLQITLLIVLPIFKFYFCWWATLVARRRGHVQWPLTCDGGHPRRHASRQDLCPYLASKPAACTGTGCSQAVTGRKCAAGSCGAGGRRLAAAPPLPPPPPNSISAERPPGCGGRRQHAVMYAAVPRRLDGLRHEAERRRAARARRRTARGPPLF